ncbi:hypothetical protein [Streptomyces sp. NPDC001594]|uniref:hypothetical protein n=1 Tax=Streptomyces sp. NPDC001594 TaxID=3364590 RepID=UPI003691E51E
MDAVITKAAASATGPQPGPITALGRWLAHLLVTMGDLSADAEEDGAAQSAYEAMLDRLSAAE